MNFRVRFHKGKGSPRLQGDYRDTGRVFVDRDCGGGNDGQCRQLPQWSRICCLARPGTPTNRYGRAHSPTGYLKAGRCLFANAAHAWCPAHHCPAKILGLGGRIVGPSPLQRGHCRHSKQTGAHDLGGTRPRQTLRGGHLGCGHVSQLEPAVSLTIDFSKERKRPTQDGKQVRPGRGKPGRDLERHRSTIR